MIIVIVVKEPNTELNNHRECRLDPKSASSVIRRKDRRANFITQHYETKSYPTISRSIQA